MFEQNDDPARHLLIVHNPSVVRFILLDIRNYSKRSHCNIYLILVAAHTNNNYLEVASLISRLS